MRIKNTLVAVSMPIITTLAFNFWKGAELNSISELLSLTWICNILLPLVPALMFSLALIHSGIKRGIWSARLYTFEVMFPFAWIAVWSIAGLMPLYTVFAFLTFPVACGCSRTATKAITCDSDIIDDLDSRTTTLQLFFSIILSLTFVVSKFV